MKSKTIAFVLLSLAICLPSYAQTSGSALQVQSHTQTLTGLDSIKGSVEINGEKYIAMCDCENADAGAISSMLAPKCDPSQFKMNRDKNGTGASFNQVRDLVGMATELQIVNIEKQYFSCLDGRYNVPVLGTPGGDAGEFITALAAYSLMINGTLSQDAVDNIFQGYLDYMKADFFYMCTDDAALAHIQSQIQAASFDLQSPRVNLQSEILEALMQSVNNGDTHISLLLSQPDKYSINGDIVKKFLKSFYGTLWDKSATYYQRLKLDILAGPRGMESGFLEIRSNEACTAAKQAPLIQPSSDGVSVYVNHLDAASVKRVDLAKYFAEIVSKQKGVINPEEFHAALDHMGLMNLEVTGKVIAKNLPFYTMNVL